MKGAKSSAKHLVSNLASRRSLEIFAKRTEALGIPIFSFKKTICQLDQSLDEFTFRAPVWKGQPNWFKNFVRFPEIPFIKIIKTRKKAELENSSSIFCPEWTEFFIASKAFSACLLFCPGTYACVGRKKACFISCPLMACAPSILIWHRRLKSDPATFASDPGMANVCNLQEQACLQAHSLFRPALQFAQVFHTDLAHPEQPGSESEYIQSHQKHPSLQIRDEASCHSSPEMQPRGLCGI